MCVCLCVCVCVCVFVCVCVCVWGGASECNLELYNLMCVAVAVQTHENTLERKRAAVMEQTLINLEVQTECNSD